MASKILLADDSITIQKVVNLTFADEGIEVVAVSNGDQAERRLAEVNPDLVLADIFMPGKNGYELCEVIKESAQFGNVPVVLLVGAFEPFDQAEARRVRADAHLTKPFESRTLVETVRRLISASPRTTTGPIVKMSAADAGHDEASDARDGSTAAPPLVSQFAAKLDLSAMADRNTGTPTPPVRNTGELASPEHDAQPDFYDIGAADAPAIDAFSATVIDASERFEPLEFSANGKLSPFEITPSFDLDAQDPNAHEMIQDFETPALGLDGSSQDPISFETGPGASFEGDTASEGTGESWFSTDSFDTGKLNQPSGDPAWRAPSNGSALRYQSPDFSLQHETGYRASEASTDNACATLLAVDEPLGDVLFDDAVSDQLAASEMSSSDLLGLGLMEQEVVGAGPTVSTQFDLVDLDGESTAEAATAEAATFEGSTAEEATTAQEPTADDSTLEASTAEERWTAEASTAEASTAAPSISEASSAAERNAEVVEHFSAEETPFADEQLESVAEQQPFDSHPASQFSDEDLDWTTPRASAYSTAQLDSVVMPIATAEYLAASEAAPQPENSEEASFATPTMWTEQEARFTPIDIEAVSVEGTMAEEASAPGTGFEFSSLPAEPEASQGETPVPASAQESANGAPAATLSPVAIEEIVRRVVAEMSESVVREVAWEVVPDCVERVIEQLTRESLSRRA